MHSRNISENIQKCAHSQPFVPVSHIVSQSSVGRKRRAVRLMESGAVSVIRRTFEIEEKADCRGDSSFRLNMHKTMTFLHNLEANLCLPLRSGECITPHK